MIWLVYLSYYLEWQYGFYTIIPSRLNYEDCERTSYFIDIVEIKKSTGQKCETDHLGQTEQPCDTNHLGQTCDTSLEERTRDTRDTSQKKQNRDTS